MKQFKYLINLLIFFLLFACFSLNAQQLSERFIPGLLHVKIKPAAETVLPDFDVASMDKSKIENYPMLSKLIEPYEIQTIQRPYAKLKTVNMENTYKIKFKKESEIEGLIEAIQKNHEIEYVEKIPVYKKSLVPNDPLYNDMWFMPIIQAAEGWDLAQNNKEVIVGVVDDAVQINHEDLQNNMWQNTAELNGTDGSDDDGNGYIDDYYGWDAVNLDGDPSPVSNAGNGYMDHGTHVAGTVGAVTNNNRGIAAIANNHMKLMGARGADNQDQFTKIYEALTYTILSGAEIINNSWGRSIWKYHLLSRTTTI